MKPKNLDPPYISSIKIEVTVDSNTTRPTRDTEEKAMRAAEEHLFNSREGKRLIKLIGLNTTFQDIIEKDFDSGEPGDYEKFPPNFTFTFLFEA